MRKLYLFAAMAAMLAACSSDDLTKESAVAQQNADDGAVVFDAYMQRSITTRGGVTGVLTATDLKKTDSDFGKAGFGVFGYYTDNGTYDQQAIPNFFYNQQVKYTSSGYFDYTPVKYWPNEYGTSAISEDQDKVSYFAYAPYVQVSPSTGKVVDPESPTDQAKAAELQKWGINSLSRNSATGDPLVKYIASFDQDKSVDLLWGVCDETTWPLVFDNKSQSINDGETGLPWLNVQRPADPTALGAGQKVKFTFKHATAQLKVMINAFVDGTDDTNPIKPETKVYVRSITFEGFAMKGALNLNNTEAGANKAYWMDFNGGNDLVTGETVTIFDGRKDGKEGTPSGEATNEKTLGLNPALVQSTVWNDAEATPGVTNVLQNLFRKYDKDAKKFVAANAPIYVIPTGDPVRVKIVYDIETADGNLSTYVSDAIQTGSSIENCIEKPINFGKDTKMENGKSYVINLHLGMNSVKFDAHVTEWIETSDADVDLPSNVPVYAVGTNPTYDVTLPANVTSYTFAVTGLNGGETVTFDNIEAPVTDPTAGSKTFTANASGVAIITIPITANTSVKKNEDGAIDVVSNSGKKVTIKIKQDAAPLNLVVKSVNFSGKTITLEADPTDWSSKIAALTDIKVLKNDAELGVVDSDPGDDNTKIWWDASSKKFTLVDDMQPGDTYTITIKSGDAESETVVYKVKSGLLSFSGPVSKDVTESPFTIAVSQEGDGTVTYSSSSEATATVADGGVVSILTPGITTIKATVDQSSAKYLYAKNTAEYTLVVYASYPQENITTTTTRNFNIGKEGGDGYFIITGMTNLTGLIAELAPAVSWFTVNLEEIDATTVKVKYSVKEYTGGSSHNTTVTVKNDSNEGAVVKFTQK